MKGYYFKKILSSLFVLFIIISLNFFLPRMIFQDPAQPYYAGVPEDAYALREQIREEYGFNDPLIVQYFDYLGNVFTLDFGESHYYKESVWTVMFSRIPWSMVLTLSSTVISITLGIIYGAIAGKRREHAADKALLWLSGVTTAIPSFWLALVSVMLFAFTIQLFPYRGAMTAGYTLTFNMPLFLIVFAVCIILAVALCIITKKSLFVFVGIPVSLLAGIACAVPPADILDVAYHAALPVMISVFSGTISYALLVRNSMIAVTNEDYILTARAKGLPSSVVLYKHTFRNALLPLITNVGMSMAGLLGGSVLMEKIFSWPGMGQLLLDACNNGDYLLSQAILLLFAVITVVCNFITDLVYHKFDPRVKEV
ncbi:MAG: ABC transporter permease [Clostridia bacterium]|nr:ABC transporter permease [Clostridia bacterium]